jgi:hypothetical protein
MFSPVVSQMADPVIDMNGAQREWHSPAAQARQRMQQYRGVDASTVRDTERRRRIATKQLRQLLPQFSNDLLDWIVCSTKGHMRLWVAAVTAFTGCVQSEPLALGARARGRLSTVFLRDQFSLNLP